jgi:hypothetical protein
MVEGVVDRSVDQYPLARTNADFGGRGLRICLGTLLAALAGLVFLDLWTHPDRYQNDLQAYYFAGMASREGLDPYDLGVLSQLAHTPVRHGFVYPPITLPFFRALGELPYAALYRGFLLAKVALLGGLICLWLRVFVKRQTGGFLLFAATAFNAAVYVDLRVGNIAVFEQALIWTGFYFLLKKKPALFTLFILVASSFKITPILLLGLLFLSSDKRRYGYLGLGIALFLALHFSAYLVSPPLTRAFITASGALHDRGVVNPSTAALIQDASAIIARYVVGPIPSVGLTLTYLCISLAVIVMTLKAVGMLTDTQAGQKELQAILIACLGYGLVIPRFKTYSYMLVLVPCYYILMEAGRRLSASHGANRLLLYAPLAGVTVVSSAYAAVYGSTLAEGVVLGYAPLAALFVAWVIFLNGIGLSRPGWLLTQGMEGGRAVGLRPAEVRPQAVRG